MRLNLDLDSEIPIYQQIRDRLVEAVADGRLAEGTVLPSTRKLASDLAINFHTVGKAYDLLRREGVIRINRGSGAVVRRDRRSGPAAPRFVEDWHRRLRTLLAEAEVLGLSRSEVIERCSQVQRAFGQAAADPTPPVSARL
ncbi:GntR family transcriptional regulator [Actinoalloteichus caeruleus]|uniref:GntR family transcriptional regulator n=1 Tax=Actinoalloteichus cyanogriseus TaxID=2893586 RepID=UPI0004AB6F62|nr:GntR family transcriptional regulator [Actinoalloteichus caeruleus]